MKKTVIIILALLLLTPLLACESYSQDPWNDWTDPPTDTPAKTTVYPYLTYIPEPTGYAVPDVTEVVPIDVQTPDPSTYMIRSWENYMRMPTDAEILAVKGTNRSPYIAMYYRFPDLGRALEYCVDLHTDHQPRGTYLCPFNWWLNVSGLSDRYESVYNDYTGTPGGYCGFQILEDDSRVFIMTEWSAFCRDYSGNVTVFTPEVLYPEGQGKGNTDSGEGTFTQCIVPYDWRAGRDYRVLLQQSRSNTTGNVVFTTYVCDLFTGRWDKLVSYDAGIPDVYIRSIGGFSENFVPNYTGEIRSMELFNLRARSAETRLWVSANSVMFKLNGSVSDMGWKGSAAYGTDGCSIWSITSGVGGLCEDPPAEVTYPLTPGDTSEPY